MEEDAILLRGERVMNISLGVGNYYGKVNAYEKKGKYYLELDNYDEPSIKEISKEFYEAIVKEFAD